MPNELIKPPDNSLAPTVKYTGKRMYVKFSGGCLKQDKITLNHRKTMNTYTVYDLKSNLNNFDPILENSLFGAVKLTKNNDNDKYEYSGYGTAFDSKGTFTHPRDGIGQNMVIFGIDMSSSVHANNRTKNVLIVGEGFTQGLEDTTLYVDMAYTVYSIRI